jgi:DtxR family transcriptional regulator, Mn-dependent transcriptional regulator
VLRLFPSAPPDERTGGERPRSPGTGLRRAARPFSPSVEDYAKTLYRLEQLTDDPVPTGAIAARVDVSAPSASNMVRHLQELGLVSVVPGRGTRLTPAGRQVARGVIRRHRIIECFLMDALKLPWDCVHEEADLLEHAVSSRVAEAMWEALGRPARDPHGDPITGLDDDVDPDKDILEPLEDWEPDAVGVLVRVSDAQPEALRYMAEHGIAPGLPVRVIAREPFGAGQRVRIGDTDQMIGPELARLIFVRRTA